MMKKTEGSKKIKEKKFFKNFFSGFLHVREGVWKRMKKKEVFSWAKKKFFLGRKKSFQARGRKSVVG